MEDLTRGELLSIDLNYPVVITADIFYQDEPFSWFLNPGGPSLCGCGLYSLWCMFYIDYSLLECCPVQCPDWLLPGRDLQIESLKRDLELLRAELERIKAEVRNVRHLVCFRQEEVWLYFSSFCEGSAIRHATEVPNQQYRGRIRGTACAKATCAFGEWTAAYGARSCASE